MRIGIPREIKIREYRVGIVPANVKELAARGHEIVVESGAGAGIAATDADYVAAGARIVATAREVFDAAELIVKVKEPQALERPMLRPGQLLFTFLHLAPDPGQARDLIASGATCIAYETVTAEDGSLPLLAPMSEIAGRLSVQAGAHFLERAHGGKGILLGGVPGVVSSKVVVIGGGAVGTHAAEVAVGMGAEVWVLDRNLEALRRLSARFGRTINTVFSTRESIARHCADADLVIGAVLVPGAASPKVIPRDIVRSMKSRTVIVDVAIDQGGCCETSRPTTHDDPVYIEEGVIHYCVANMPGSVPNTSAYALNNATLPYIVALADHGLEALRRDRQDRKSVV